MRAIERKHLSEQLGAHLCPCGALASRLIRCRVCRTVIARCGSGGCGGDDMAKLAREHCPAPGEISPRR